MCYIAYTQTDSLPPCFSKCSDIFYAKVDLCLSVNDNAEIRILGLHKEMADKRKLQGEIERCIKKVTEGVEVFEDLWQKIYSTTNINIKEKHEADLKKEIKKLQRLRDNIKNWLTSPDVKDKETLLEYKRLIEQQMERFKVVEKETKTKAYSKEGLGSMAKVDPKEKEKEAISTWLSTSIDSLKLQTDQIESEVEGLSARKKKVDRDKQDHLESCKYILERLKHHIGRLELVMRLVDNDALPLDQIHKIKEDVDYYVSSNREAGFAENDFIYDDLRLDEVSAALGSKMVDTSTTADDDLSTTLNLSDTTSLPSSSCPSPTPSNLSHNTVHKDEISRERKKSHSEDFQMSGSKSSSTTPNNKPQHSTSSNNIVNRSLPFSIRSNNDLQHQSSQPLSTLVVSGQNYAQVASLGVHNHQDTKSSKVDAAVDGSWRADGKAPQKQPQVSSSPRTKQQKQNQHMMAAPVDVEKRATDKFAVDSSEVARTPEDAPNHVVQSMDDPTPPEILPSSINSIDEFLDDKSFAKKFGKEVDDLKVSAAPVAVWPSFSMAAVQSSCSVSTCQVVNGSLHPIAAAYSHVARPPPIQPQIAARTPYSSSSSLPSYSVGSSKTIKVDLPCMFGGKQLTSAETQGLDRISAALDRFPQSADSKTMISIRVEDYFKTRLEDHVHLKPLTQLVPLPFYQEPLYHNFHCDTLFFIFYYMEGTLAQFLAAKALKNLSWRFHTKYLTWFQRMMDPSVITEEYEQGSYVYFDFVEWAQKNLDTFTFEYKYLEDKEL